MNIMSEEMGGFQQRNRNSSSEKYIIWNEVKDGINSRLDTEEGRINEFKRVN